jgi:hypothetical protein
MLTTFVARSTLRDLLFNNSIYPLVSLLENCFELSLSLPAKDLPQIRKGAIRVTQAWRLPQ